ncbi:FAD binding domain-containing protein [Paraphysoderma sedebokerense]|nr:FAD binding domain-containing protein [Paraphysoderma sedebokerense]
MTADSSQSASIIVVGSGLAGLSASIEAYRAGATVTILEKEKNVGGNSAKATSGMNSVDTPHQQAMNIKDSIEDFENDTFKSGSGLSDPLLVKVLSSSAKDALAWVESFGITLSKISQCGGHSQPRTHREPPRPDGKPAPVGWDIIKTLKEYVFAEMKEKSNPSYGSLKVVTEARVVDFIMSEDKESVKGVKYESVDQSNNAKQVVQLESDAVILTTGGYAADYSTPDSLLREYVPNYLDIPTTNGAWATGDGMKLGRSLGAWLTDMDKVQIHPTGFVDPKNETAKVKFLAPEALRGHGGILLNPVTGLRFTNELGTRAAVTADIFSKSFNIQSSPISHQCLLVLNAAAVDLFDPAVINFYIGRGFFHNVNGPSELAQFIMNVRQQYYHPLVSNGTAKIESYGPVNSPDEASFVARNVESMFSSLKAAQISGKDEFGKTVFPVNFTGNADEKYFICRITPSIHYTMGGLKINAAAEIVRPPSKAPISQVPNGDDIEIKVHDDGIPIKGLFGAGEVTGGVHGANRLAGNSLLECVVFGRVAGQRAARITSYKYLPALTPDSFTPLRFRTSKSLGKYVRLFRFDLPSTHHQSGLKVGEYIAVKAILGEKKEELVRFYSPVNRPDQLGFIDLLIKVDDKGLMSHHIATLKPGDSLEFKGPISGFGDLHLEDPTQTKVKKIAMICGGTGVSPMAQIIRSVFHHHRNDIDVKLIYGAADDEDLVFREIFESKAKTHKNFKFYFTVDKVFQSCYFKLFFVFVHSLILLPCFSPLLLGQRIMHPSVLDS